MTKRTFFVLFLFSCLFTAWGDAEDMSGLWHTVATGETVKIIGEKYGVNAYLIAGVNNMDDWNMIHVGDKLWIPGAKPLTQTYVVMKNDYLIKIAEKFGMTPWAIAEANGLYDMNVLEPGQILIIPQD